MSTTPTTPPLGDACAIDDAFDGLRDVIASTSVAAREAIERCVELGARGDAGVSARASARRNARCYPGRLDFGRVWVDDDGRSTTRRSRTVFVTNVSRVPSEDAIVLGAWCEPKAAEFRLADAPGPETGYVVTLPGGNGRTTQEPHPLRLEFDARARKERGSAFVGTFVLVAVASREKVNAILARKTSVREAIEEIAKLVEVHASQAHAFVSRGNTIDTVLDVDAVPFYPAALRNLFNSSEQMFPMHQAWRVRNVDPRGDEFVVRVRKAQRFTDSEAGHDFVVDELSRWSGLLKRERRAQQKHIEELDMFHAELTLAPPNDVALAKSPDSKTSLRDSLYYLEVPGLAEQRPLVLAGDRVFTRVAQNIAIEIPLTVQHVDTRRSRLYFVAPGLAYLRNRGIIRVHVRFTLNLVVFKMFHSAIERVLLHDHNLHRFLPSSITRKCQAHLQTPVRQTSGATTPLNDHDESDVSDVLNEEQARVVRDILRGAGRSAPYIVWGPPGTGKTLTIVECVAHVLEKDSSARILLAAPAAFAADILCSRLAERINFKNALSELVRVNDERRTPESVKADVRMFCLDYAHTSTAKSGAAPFNFFRVPSENDLAQARVVICTCTSADLLTNRFRPTHIFVDEAAQALVPETFIPLSLAGKETSVILAGDSKQLGPVVHDKVAARDGLNKSLLEMWMDQSGVSHGTQLRACYRSHADIVQLPSRLFYDGSVVSRASEENIALPDKWDEFAHGAGNGRAARFLFYGVKGRQRREGNTTSWTNPVEAAELVDLLVSLLKTTTLTTADVAVMATYRRQVMLIRMALRERGLGAIRVGTVDDYQGQEEKIVFISTVVTRPTTLNALDPEVGFLNNPKRFNVAISRAMALNVIVGHPLVLLTNPLWSELLRDCVRRDAFRGAGAEYLPRWAGGGGNDDAGDLPGHDDDGDIASAVASIASLALLGSGAAESMESADDHAWDDFGDQPSWRVAI